MADLPIHLCCADYARLMPLARGEVSVPGIDLTLTLGRGGSWPDRAEMLRRALNDPAVDGGESSMCRHLMRLAAGDRSHVALPVFPLRGFTARDLYVRAGGAVRVPADLQGRRIGMYGWANSGAVWYRHLLEYFGVSVEGIEWWIGTVDEPQPASGPGPLPAGVQAVATGRSLSEMLIAGEIDALFSPPRPLAYHRENGPIVRLTPDFPEVESEYFRRTAMFPVQHLVLVRRAVWESNRWIAGALTEGFSRCNDAFTAAQRNFPYATPWLEDELERTEALLGEDFHPYGFERNREQVRVFADQAYRSGIVGRMVEPEEFFREYLES
ncbi:substrate-binding domain-containing protein [Roseomonas elaeocarpi]|uniref:4,5-dihydroxyphthalate decarboxylase n=1 Tax=Roseomonas elaeocarpi TaxID=907779 RepID=A0ABV6JXF8_9PROT